MRRSVSIGTGATVAALLTHGMVYAAMDLSQLLPISTYRGFFQHLLFAMERLWSQAHGQPSMSHIEEFGVAYSRIVPLLCPLIGFALFLILSRYHVRVRIWKPIAIAVIMASPLHVVITAPLQALGLGTLWSEVARTVLLVLSMVWSVGALQIPTLQAPAAELPEAG